MIKNRWFDYGGDFDIKDANGVRCFDVRGALFTGNMFLTDAFNGWELATIHPEMRIGMPHFKIFRNGVHTATIKQKFHLLKSEFEIDMVDGNVVKVHGDWSGYQFTFDRGGKLVASVGRELFSIRDVFGVEILPGEDNVLMLCCVIVIDKCVNYQPQQPGFQQPGFQQPGFREGPGFQEGPGFSVRF
jgi:uncharacterized protein YxjI